GTAVPDLEGIISLENFLGKVREDDHIDYYKAEIGKHTSREEIEKIMLQEFSQERQENFMKGTEPEKQRKPLYDKFAPIFFCREMYKISKKGNHIPGWFAGPSMVRRVSEGNPRLFIQLMNDLFDHARNHTLTLKAQHKVISQFASRICEATRGLPVDGPRLYMILNEIADNLHAKVHEGILTDSGNDFFISNAWEDTIIEALKLGVQYSRLATNSSDLVDGISKDTIFSISNCYAVKYWIPMRKG